MNTEDAAGEMTLQVMFYLFVLFILAFSIFTIQRIQAVDFKTYVSGQLEKNGGFTDTAIENIENYSEEHYDGRLAVRSLSGYEKLSYGETIEFEIVGRITILFFDLPDQITTIRGSAESMVR